MKYYIQGKYASEFSQTLEVAVVKCTNESNPERPCANESQIEAYFQQQQSFFFTIYFINPLINPTSEEYLTHYLEDNNYIIFTKDLGAEGVLFMQGYTVSTDESILPFAVTHEQTGGIVTQFALKNPYQVTGDVYCSFAFFKSGISRSYQRNFQKLDEILSYIGGLFGTIAIALFLVNAYNGNSFQITLGAYLFHSKDQKQGNKLKKYNFLSYMLQALYSFLNLLGCPPKWKTIKEYYICRQEMVKQLDVLYILKRVFFLERTINILFEEHQLKGIHLQQNMTLEQAKRNRKNFKLKRQLLNKAACVKKKLKSDESVVNVTEQLINFPDAKIYKTQQYNSTGQKPINFQQMGQKIAAKDVNIFVEKSTQSQSQQTVDHFISQDSESSESENDDDLGYEMKKLRAEAQKSDSISSKIWRNIDRRILGQMPYIVPKDRCFATTQSQISQETSEIGAKTKILKISPFGQYENRDSYGGEPKDSKTKIGKHKYDRKEFYQEEAYYEDWKRGSQQPQNVVLENELPE